MDQICHRFFLCVNNFLKIFDNFVTNKSYFFYSYDLGYFSSSKIGAPRYSMDYPAPRYSMIYLNV